MISYLNYNFAHTFLHMTKHTHSIAIVIYNSQIISGKEIREVLMFSLSRPNFGNFSH